MDFKKQHSLAVDNLCRDILNMPAAVKPKFYRELFLGRFGRKNMFFQWITLHVISFIFPSFFQKYIVEDNEVPEAIVNDIRSNNFSPLQLRDILTLMVKNGWKPD